MSRASLAPIVARDEFETCFTRGGLGHGTASSGEKAAIIKDAARRRFAKRLHISGHSLECDSRHTKPSLEYENFESES